MTSSASSSFPCTTLCPTLYQTTLSLSLSISKSPIIPFFTDQQKAPWSVDKGVGYNRSDRGFETLLSSLCPTRGVHLRGKNEETHTSHVNNRVWLDKVGACRMSGCHLSPRMDLSSCDGSSDLISRYFVIDFDAGDGLVKFRLVIRFDLSLYIYRMGWYIICHYVLNLLVDD